MAVSLILILACSCKTTVKPAPTRAEKLEASQSVTYEQPKSHFKYNKKPGNALADFQRDNRNGGLNLKQYGAPGEITPYFNKLLRDELGISVEIVGDGILPADFLRYAKQYNALMTAEIQKKYGPEILQEAQRRARVIYQKVQAGSLR